MSRKPRGFTIVELLIVIVVIGILASITIVAYNGVQSRAENTKTVQAVSQYVKAIHSYASINGNYPIETLYPCLGSNSPQTTCGNVGGGPICQAGSTASNATFEANIRTVLNGTLPQPSAQRMTCGTTQTSGAYYNPTTGKTGSIIYFLKGDVTCEAIGGVQSISKVFQDESTRCFATLPTLP